MILVLVVARRMLIVSSLLRCLVFFRVIFGLDSYVAELVEGPAGTSRHFEPNTNTQLTKDEDEHERNGGR